MKQVYIGAAALLLGTSTLAWAGGKPADFADKGAKAMEVGAKTVDSKAEMAKPLDWSKAAQPAASWGWSKAGKDEPKIEQASATWTANDEALIFAKKGEGDPDLDLAVKPDMTQPEQVSTGMGGPLEEVDTAAVSPADLAPHPATHSYPPCSPGPGDDNCIQLYERGVRDRLASWSPPAETGVGGPYEPIDMPAGASADTKSETKMAGDGKVDGALGEVMGDEPGGSAVG
ncbi:MAG: hypothetical protein E6G92_08185 [Alphaproteobacteria bacterium]|nr:MAG: hypothetical protein E6G92_08185 [Alphaproteobacteria bacterium]